MTLYEQINEAYQSDPNLNAAIAMQAGWVLVRSDDYRWQHPNGEWHQSCPDFTGSVDAALSLLSHMNCLVSISCRRQPDMGGRMWNASIHDGGTSISGGQRTMALAICAAVARNRRW